MLTFGYTMCALDFLFLFLFLMNASIFSFVIEDTHAFIHFCSKNYFRSLDTSSSSFRDRD